MIPSKKIRTRILDSDVNYYHGSFRWKGGYINARPYEEAVELTREIASVRNLALESFGDLLCLYTIGPRDHAVVSILGWNIAVDARIDHNE